MTRRTTDLFKNALLILNTYDDIDKYKLSNAVLQNGYLMEHKLKLFGYEVVTLVNESLAFVLASIENILKNSKYALIYYCGHGVQNASKTDEGIVFTRDMKQVRDDVKILKDDVLADYLNRYNRTSQLILFNDCCHSKSLWDLENVYLGIGQTIINISACDESEKAYLLKDSSVLTLNFWRFFDGFALDVESLRNSLKKYGQTLSLTVDNVEVRTKVLMIRF